MDLEFLNGIDRRVDDQVVKQLVGHLEPIEHIDVVTSALAADVGQWARLLQCATPGPVRRNHHRIAQLSKSQKLSPVERDLLDLAGLNDVTNLGRGHL